MLSGAGTHTGGVFNAGCATTNGVIELFGVSAVVEIDNAFGVAAVHGC